MKTNPIAAAIKGAFTGGGVNPSEPTNTPVVLASQAEPAAPEPRADHGEKDGNGTMPEAATFKSDRSRVLKEIADRRNAQAVEEGNESIPDPDAESNPTPEPEAGADLDADPDTTVPGEPVAAAPVVAAAPAAPEETRELIVDGKRVQVPISQIVETGTRALQKEIAADNRLAQATAILEEAKRAAQPPAQPQAPAEPTLADKTDDELAELVQFGTKDQAAQVMKFLRSGSQPQIKPEEIVRAAQQAVAPAIAFEEGKKFAQTEYGDLLADPDYRAIFLMKENALRQSGDQRGYVELYTGIGEEMRQKFGRPKPGAATPTAKAAPSTQTRTMAEKQAAKAQAPAAPRLASARLDGDGGQQKVPSRAEVFARMRDARGFKRGADLN